MSGECEKCGEHALECACPKYIAGPNDKFYYQGQSFEKEEEFWAYVRPVLYQIFNASTKEGEKVD